MSRVADDGGLLSGDLASNREAFVREGIARTRSFPGQQLTILVRRTL